MKNGGKDEIEAEFEIEDIRLRRRAGWRCVRTSGALSLEPSAAQALRTGSHQFP